MFVPSININILIYDVDWKTYDMLNTIPCTYKVRRFLGGIGHAVSRKAGQVGHMCAHAKVKSERREVSHRGKLL